MNYRSDYNSIPCNTIGENRNEDGSLQNPTIIDKAKKISSIMGKKSARRILCTVWCDSEDFRKSEFEKILKVWKLTTVYCLFGPIEWTEENKKPHFHAFMCWSSPKNFKTIIKTLDPHFYHIEPSKTTNEAVEYCIKTNPDDILEFGELPKQGERTDLKDMLKQYKFNINEIKNNEPELYRKFRSGLNDICEYHQSKKSMLDWLGLKENENGEIERKEYKPTIVHWFFGPTGKGKTYEIKKILSSRILNGELKPDDITRIDNFKGDFAIGDLNVKSKIVIIDEFRGDKLKLGELLQLIDGCNVNIKGSKLYIHAEEIFITSCQHPKEAYHSVKSDKVDQLMRRLTDIRNFGSEDYEDDY